MGGGFCVSPSTYSCCPYFGRDDGVCVETCDKNVNSTNHCTDECDNYWTGTNCQSKCYPCTGCQCKYDDDCQLDCSLECFNGGMADANCAECVCLSGYTGEHCEDKVPCNTSYCLHGGTPDETNCTKSTCPNDYYGDRCEHVIDPCESNPCLNEVLMLKTAVSTTRASALRGGRVLTVRMRLTDVLRVTTVRTGECAFTLMKLA